MADADGAIEEPAPGAEVREVHDRAIVGGAVSEDTLDWFAQDAAGHVWYMGEDTKTLENGQVKSTQGSWVAGGRAGVPHWGVL